MTSDLPRVDQYAWHLVVDAPWNPLFAAELRDHITDPCELQYRDRRWHIAARHAELVMDVVLAYYPDTQWIDHRVDPHDQHNHD